jgi:hypothetical protein
MVAQRSAHNCNKQVQIYSQENRCVSHPFFKPNMATRMRWPSTGAWLPRLALVLAMLYVCAQADVYLHHPRGSNNRLNERSANRNNANRLFDSQVCLFLCLFGFFPTFQRPWHAKARVLMVQNNNRGGYNKGDRTDQAFQTYADQYHMVSFFFFVGGTKFVPFAWVSYRCGHLASVCLLID